MASRGAFGFVLALAAFSITVGAQERTKGGVPDTLQRVDSHVPGQVVTGTYAWERNTHTAWHTHPGEMIGHVSEGRIALEQKGEDTSTFRLHRAERKPITAPVLN